MSSTAFDQALALVHDSLLHQQANGVRAGVPLEALRRLVEVAGPVRADGDARPVEALASLVRPVATARIASEPAGASVPSAPALPVERETPATVAEPAATVIQTSRAKSKGGLSAQVRAHLAPETTARVAAPQGGVSSGTKAERMARLRARAEDQLALSSTPLVFGTGSLDAEIFFIGDAPGSDEEQAGQPFMDEAGQMLTRIIQTMGLKRDAVYLANLLQTRSEQPRGRALPPEEVALHLPYLIEQIQIVQPRCLVAMGGSTVEALLRTGQRIDRIRGQWQQYQGIALIPTFHVVYLHTTNNPLHKRKVWEDMLSVLEHLGHPISEKQRGYFRMVRG